MMPECPKCGKSDSVKKVGYAVVGHEEDYMTQDYACLACEVIWTQEVEWRKDGKRWRRI